MLVNDGRGSLTLKQDLNVSIVGAGFHLSGGDVNGDGHCDIMVGIGTRAAAVVLLGDGDFGFTQVTVPVRGYQGDVQLVDMNNDSVLDFVALVGDGQDLAIMRGNGMGGFEEIDINTEGVFPFDLEPTDLDQDGDVDIVVGSAWFSINVFDNAGLGLASWIASVPMPSTPDALTAADFDANGYPDLAVCSGTLDTVTVLLSARGTVTAVLVSMIEHEFAEGLLKVTWYSTSPTVSRATVYRRERGTWEAKGGVDRGPDERLVWADDDVRPGETYAYRLGMWQEGREVFVGEIVVSIPSSPTLDLSVAGRNPADRDLRLVVSLAAAEPASLTLCDVTGRRIESREVGTLGAGSHTVGLAEGKHLAAGIYLARLEQGGKFATCKVVVTQ